jgi:Ser/Thr protein kinase RdoA (MazF antagonist)
MSPPPPIGTRSILGADEDNQNIFPVTSSILSSEALLQEIAADYPIETPLSCQFLKQGLNDSYLVQTTNEQYILRIYKVGWRTLSDILYEAEMLSYLGQQSAPVSTPVKRLDGTFIRGLRAPEGIRQMVLFTYAKGVEPTLTEEQGYLMGKATATIHLTSDGFCSQHPRFTLDLEHLIHEPLRRVQPYLAHRKEDWAYLLQLADILSQKITDLAPHLDWGFCHGDATERNAHITEDQQITFFDFDCGGPGWRAYDWAVFHMNARKRPDGAAIWNAYLKGYAEKRPINPVDLKAEPLMFIARMFWSIGILIIVTPYDGLEWYNQEIDRYIRFLHILEERHIATNEA